MEEHLSVYIHIPFCVRKCNYCDFSSFTASEDEIRSYFDALKREIREEEVTAGRTADTVYIGGGTPSSVAPEFIYEVMEEVKKKYILAEDAEISMEMNPGTLKEEGPGIYAESGINRISLGCQSLNDQTLKRLGRIHSAADVYRTFDTLRNKGFDNINLDLISSVPGEGTEELLGSVKGVMSLKPEHISVYSLILEPGTPFFKEYEKGEMKDLPDEDEIVRNDEALREVLKNGGYHRYEISNYSLPGKECRHNLVYWRRGDYRGFGLGAASLIGNRRFTNVRNMVYINLPGRLYEEEQYLTEKEAMEEFMFLGLRECRGVETGAFRERFDRDIMEVFGARIREQKEQGFLEEESGRIYYNDRGLDVSNVLMSLFTNIL